MDNMLVPAIRGYGQAAILDGTASGGSGRDGEGERSD